MGNRKLVDIRSYISPKLSRREPPPEVQEDDLPADKRLWQKFGAAVTLINEVIEAVSAKYLDDCDSQYSRAVRAQELARAEECKALLILSMHRLRTKEPLPDDFD